MRGRLLSLVEKFRQRNRVCSRRATTRRSLGLRWRSSYSSGGDRSSCASRAHCLACRAVPEDCVTADHDEKRRLLNGTSEHDRWHDRRGRRKDDPAEAGPCGCGLRSAPVARSNGGSVVPAGSGDRGCEQPRLRGCPEDLADLVDPKPRGKPCGAVSGDAEPF
jgi:hypothetical protein